MAYEVIKMNPSKRITELSDRVKRFESNFNSIVQKISEAPEKTEERTKLLEALNAETVAMSREVTSVLLDFIKTQECHSERSEES